MSVVPENYLRKPSVSKFKQKGFHLPVVVSAVDELECPSDMLRRGSEVEVLEIADSCPVYRNAVLGDKVTVTTDMKHTYFRLEGQNGECWIAPTSNIRARVKGGEAVGLNDEVDVYDHNHDAWFSGLVKSKKRNREIEVCLLYNYDDIELQEWAEVQHVRKSRAKFQA